MLRVLSSLCFFLRFLPVLLVFVISQRAGASELNQASVDAGSIRAWVLPVMGASITRSKIALFIDDLARAVGRSIDVRYSNDTEELMSACKRQDADMFVLSNDERTTQIRTLCGYRDIAVSRNAINLYVKGNASRQDIHRIGLVHFTRSHDAALRELHDVEFIEYGDIPKAFMALMDGQVDAVVSPPAITMMVADQLRQKLRSVQTLQEQGETVMLFSPQFMENPDSKKMAAAVLLNMPSSKALFSDLLGSGDWQSVK